MPFGVLSKFGFITFGVVSVMKKSFFRSCEHRYEHGTARPLRRALTLEPLEERTLLTAAVWGGFDTTPERYVYKNEGAAGIDFQLTPDLIEIRDVNKDGADDIVTVNYAESKTLVYFQDPANRGQFGEAVESSITVGTGENQKNLLINNVMGGPVATLGYFNGDDILDLLVVSQDNDGDETLKLRLFAGGSDGKFKLTTTSDVSLNDTLSANNSQYIGFFEMVPVGTGDAAIRFSGVGISTNVTNLDVTIRCNNNLDNNKVTGVFGSTATHLTAVEAGEDLIGSTKLNDMNFLVTQNTKSENLAFKFYNLGEGGGVSSVKYSESGQNYSVSSPDWSLISSERLYYADNSKLVVAELSATNGNVTAESRLIIALSTKTNFSQNTHAAVGNLNGNDFTDLICVTGTNYTFFRGGSETGLDYEQTETVVTNPSYLASYVIGDDLVVVGAYGIWSYENCDLSSNPRPIASFPQPAVEAKFAYLGSQTEGGSDNRIDIAVLFKDTVSLFIQTDQGEFAGGSLSSGSISVQFRETIPDDTKNPIMAVGDFLGNNSDQIVVSYLDVNLVPYLAWIDPRNLLKDTTMIPKPNQSFAVSDSYAISSLAAGKFGSASAGIVYAVDKETLGDTTTGSKLYILPVADGQINSVSPISITLDGVVKPIDFSLEDINGDTFNDIVFLDAGTGALDAKLYYLLGNAIDFETTTVLVGIIDKAGDVGGLILTDLSGDEKLDAVFSLTKDDGQSKTYVALGRAPTQEDASLFDPPAYHYLLGDDFDGIDYLPESGSKLAAPAIFATDPVTESGFRNLYLVKGKTVVFLESVERVDTAGNVCFVIRGTDTDASSFALTETEIKVQTGVYGWVDEWSRFYVEIWGTPSGAGSIKEFKTEFTFTPGYFEYGDSCEAGGIGNNQFKGVAVDATKPGTISVSGYCDSDAMNVSDGKMVLLARVLMKPVGSGGISLDDLETPGVFQGFTNVETFGITADYKNQSINRSIDVQGVDKSSFDDLVICPVRYDFNDNGQIEQLDFTSFMVYFGTKPELKYQIFKTSSGENITNLDFASFATGFGLSINSVNTRFYDLTKQSDSVPSWLPQPPSGSLLPVGEGLAVETALLSAPVHPPVHGVNVPKSASDALLIELDGPVSEFLAIDSLDELAADQVTLGVPAETGDEILPLLWNPEIADDTKLDRSDDAPESDGQIATGLETALN